MDAAITDVNKLDLVHFFDVIIYCLFLFLSVCGSHIQNSINGTIDMKFESGGGGYHHNENCEWLIEFPEGKMITLESTYFSLETGYPLCVFDSLEIWDGRNTSAPYIGKWCGTTKPPHIQSSGNYLFIRFKTDAAVSSEGFQLRYTEAPLGKSSFLLLFVCLFNILFYMIFLLTSVLYTHIEFDYLVLMKIPWVIA